MKHTRETIIALINECRKNGTRIDLSGQDLQEADLHAERAKERKEEREIERLRRL